MHGGMHRIQRVCFDVSSDHVNGMSAMRKWFSHERTYALYRAEIYDNDGMYFLRGLEDYQFHVNAKFNNKVIFVVPTTNTSK